MGYCRALYWVPPSLPCLFNNDIPSIVLSPVYLFTDDTKVFLCNQEQGWLLSPPEWPYNWSLTWQLSFNILKCKHLHLGPPHHFEAYHINSLVIDSETSHKDLGIQFDNQLKFHEHTSEVNTKANRILGMIKKSFEHLDIHMVSKL